MKEELEGGARSGSGSRRRRGRRAGRYERQGDWRAGGLRGRDEGRERIITSSVRGNEDTKRPARVISSR